MLKKYDSEYSYLFSLVKNRAEESSDNMEKDYIFPNIIRKLLENYLSFKIPIPGINIHGKFLELLTDNPEYILSDKEKNRIESYCQDNSHPLYQDSAIDFDERMMGELTDICKDVMSLIKNTDPKHFSHLKKQVEKTNTTTQNVPTPSPI